MIEDEAKRRAVGDIEWALNKLLAHVEMGTGRPVNEATLRLMPSVQQCQELADRLGAALFELQDARDERGTRSVQRVGRLLARWRERADRLQRMALEYEEEDDSINAVDCSSAAQEIRDCALDLEREMAGEEPTIVLGRTPKT